MRDIDNYEDMGSRKDRDSAEHFMRQKITGKAWVRSYSLWANDPGEFWMPLDGDCDDLFEIWKTGKDMAEFTTMEFLERMAGKPFSSLKDFSFSGYEMIEATVKPHSTSAHVGLPKKWTGCRVAIVRLDERMSEVNVPALKSEASIKTKTKKS